VTGRERYEALIGVQQERYAIDVTGGPVAAERWRQRADTHDAEADLWRAAAEDAAGRAGSFPWLEVLAYETCAGQALSRAADNRQRAVEHEHRWAVAG
jgi:hypothetical protein